METMQVDCSKYEFGSDNHEIELRENFDTLPSLFGWDGKLLRRYDEELLEYLCRQDRPTCRYQLSQKGSSAVPLDARIVVVGVDEDIGVNEHAIGQGVPRRKRRRDGTCNRLSGRC